MVLCNAFGQEAVRAHRTMRVLAERLSRAGHAVLRFDYFGAGDSMGDDLDGDLDGWAGDIHEANRVLCSLSGVTQTAWVGMRLGGTVALRAAQQTTNRLKRLVLWDPVIDGNRYLEHLRERHVATLEEAFSLPPEPTLADLARDPANFRDEALGFALSPLLRGQIAALHPAHHQWPALPLPVVVLADPDSADGRELAAVCARDPGRVQMVTVQHGIEWASDSAETGALVPLSALTELVRHAWVSK
jgi:pimeloyl-ACP methyl ester carboxylesterase